jgi:hypothetical protein
MQHSRRHTMHTRRNGPLPLSNRGHCLFSSFELTFGAPRKAHNISLVLPDSFATRPALQDGSRHFRASHFVCKKWSSRDDGTSILGVKRYEPNPGFSASCAVSDSPLPRSRRMAITPLALCLPTSRGTFPYSTIGRFLSWEEKTKKRSLSKFSGRLRSRQLTSVSPPSIYPICFNTRS